MRREILVSGPLVAGVLVLLAAMTGFAGRSEAFEGIERGLASWYGPGFQGKQTASGEAFNQFALTAAHRDFPLGSLVTVTNLNNGRQVDVEINDRGPHVGGRIIDVSKAAAQKLGMIEGGIAPVRIEVADKPTEN